MPTMKTNAIDESNKTKFDVCFKGALSMSYFYHGLMLAFWKDFNDMRHY